MKNRFLSCVLCVLPVLAPAADAPTLSCILHAMQIDGVAQSRLKTGLVVSTPLPSESPRSVAAASSVWIPVDLAVVMEVLRDGRFFAQDRDLISSTDMTQGVDFAFGPTETEETLALMRPRPGEGIHLSAGEAKRLKVVGGRFALREVEQPGPARDAMRDAYRDVLLRRARDYRRRGLDGCADYSLGDGARSPGTELRVALRANARLNACLPGVARSAADVPGGLGLDMEHQYLCLKLKAQGRPIAVLAHRSLLERSHYGVVVERQFYVGRSYNSMAIMVLCMPMDGGTLVSYLNRTSTDQVDGMGGGIARAVGRRMMREAQAEALTWLRSTLSP